MSCDLESIYYSNSSFVRKVFIKDKVLDASWLLIAISNRLFITSGTDFLNLSLLNSDDSTKIKGYLNLHSLIVNN